MYVTWPYGFCINIIRKDCLNYPKNNSQCVYPQLSESRLVVGEHEKPKEVKLISTIPIVCDNSSAHSCHLEIYLEPNNRK